METPDTPVESPLDGPILVEKPLTPKPISRREVDQKAKEMKDSRTLPPIPGKIVSDKEVTDWLAILTPEMSKRIIIYAYRTYPIINRKALDPEANNNIDIITPEILSTKGGVLRDYMVSVHGGGRYKIQINDSYADRKTEQSSLFECKLLIPLDESMPKLNYAELDTADQANKGYLQQLRNAGIVDERNRFISKVGPTNNSNGQANGNNGTESAALVGAMGTIMDKFLQFSNQNNNRDKNPDSLTQLFIEKLKQENPNAATQSNNDLLKTLLPLLIKEPPKQDFSIKDLLMMIENSRKESREEMKMMLEALKPTDKPDSLDTLIKLRTALPEMFNNSRRNNNSNGNDDEDKAPTGWKEMIMELIPPVLGIASQFMQNATGAKPIIPTNEQQAREMAGMQSNQQTPPPSTIITQVPVMSRGVDLRAQSQLTQGQDNKVVEMPSNNPSTDNIDPRFSPIVAEMLTNYGAMLINGIESGQPGEELGLQLKNSAFMFGKDIHAILAGQGVEKILFTMSCNPELWKKTAGVYGEVKIKEFVEHFVEFEKWIPEDEEN